jgi:multidrug efflux pump subunit AcrA (membrane-fusion protein)
MIQGVTEREPALALCRALNDWVAEYCAPDPEHLVGVATLPMTSAEAALAAARARLDAVRQGPSAFDVREAQLKLAQAQAALETAQADYGAHQQSLDQTRKNADLDTQALVLAAEAAQNDLGQLQAGLADAQIVAPNDGRVVRANGKPGATVQAFDAVVRLAAPGGRMVRSEITDADMPRLAVGQKVQVTLDSLPGQTFTGAVRDLPASVVTQQGVVADKGTRIAVDWGSVTPDLGILARVRIIVQQKDDVLIAPTGALRQVGKRQFVEFMDGAVKRSRTVETGVSTPVDTEIVSGLQEGEVILAGT